MDFYQSLGGLVLGSRLRRVSEYFIAEVNKVYQHHGIDFEAGWFPLFHLLSVHRTLSITTIADRLSVSHSASSQLVSQLRRKGLLDISRSENDGRKQMVSLTEQGTNLLARIQPLWDNIREAMQDLLEDHPAIAPLLPAITALEQECACRPLAQRIITHATLTHSHHE